MPIFPNTRERWIQTKGSTLNHAGQDIVFGEGAADPTGLPRAFILKWKCSRAVPMGSGILRITA